jgi:hypothetical protein
MSDGAFDVFAQPQAVGEHLGQHQDRQAEDQRQTDRGGVEQARRDNGWRGVGEGRLEVRGEVGDQRPAEQQQPAEPA